MRGRRGIAGVISGRLPACEQDRYEVMEMKRRFSHTNMDVRKEDREDVNPMEGVANLVDAMLVLSCGLMLALVINWNVDFGNAGTTVEVNQNKEVTEIDGVTANGESVSSANGYQEMGMVYRDPETGKLYMVQQSGTGGAASEGGSSSAGGAETDGGTSADGAPVSGE